MSPESTDSTAAKLPAGTPIPRLTVRNVLAFAILGAFLGLIVGFGRALLAPAGEPGGGDLRPSIFTGAAIAAVAGPILRSMALRGGFTGFLARLIFRLACLSVLGFFVFLCLMRMGSKS
jgi:hypothetical protein